jgi:hypothetical protein
MNPPLLGQQSQNTSENEITRRNRDIWGNGKDNNPNLSFSIP